MVVIKLGDRPSYYEDTGCEVCPSCLGCPLPRCRYDLRGGLQTARKQAQDLEIAAFAEREGTGAASVKYGRTLRTIHRVKARVRDYHRNVH